MAGLSGTALASAIAADLEKIGQKRSFMSQARKSQKKNPHVQALDPDRAMYEYLRSVYPTEVIVTDSFLRSVVPIGLNAITQITFVMTKNDTGESGISINNLLDQSDTFEANAFRLAWYTLATTGPGTDALGSNVSHSQAEFQFTSNPRVFSDTLEAANINGFYNGYLYIKIGSTVYFEQFPCAKFKHVSVSQQGTAVSTTTTTGVLGESSMDYDHTKRSTIPTLMIDGSGKNVFQINSFDPVIPSPTTSGVDRTNYVVFEAVGFKCQDGAKQQTKKFDFKD